MNPDRVIKNIKTVWDAHLTITEIEEGKRFSFVENLGECLLYGGIEFPQKSKSLLMGFISTEIDFVLPQSKGFSTAQVKHDTLPKDHDWISIVCNESEHEDLFLSMIRDLIILVNSHIQECSTLNLLLIVIERIKDWQDFLGKKKSRFLSREDEIGLWGELFVLKTLLEAGLPKTVVLKSWTGPEGAAKDFSIQDIGIEIKSFIGDKPIRIKINSLEQLEVESHSFVFLICNGLVMKNSEGLSLPDLVRSIEDSLDSFRQKTDFQSKLLQFGYIADEGHPYVTKFELHEQYVYPVVSEFPSLTPKNVPKEITNTIYIINLSQYNQVANINDIVKHIGELS